MKRIVAGRAFFDVAHFAAVSWPMRKLRVSGIDGPAGLGRTVKHPTVSIAEDIAVTIGCRESRGLCPVGRRLQGSVDSDYEGKRGDNPVPLIAMKR